MSSLDFQQRIKRSTAHWNQGVLKDICSHVTVEQVETARNGPEGSICTDREVAEKLVTDSLYKFV